MLLFLQVKVGKVCSKLLGISEKRIYKIAVGEAFTKIFEIDKLSEISEVVFD